MAKCALIRNCAGKYTNILNAISSSSGSTRAGYCQQLTNAIVGCLQSQGIKCKSIGKDKIDFGYIIYDVIKNCSGTGAAEISCHKILPGGSANISEAPVYTGSAGSGGANISPPANVYVPPGKPDISRGGLDDNVSILGLTIPKYLYIIIIVAIAVIILKYVMKKR